jgi:hypothetical protein
MNDEILDHVAYPLQRPLADNGSIMCMVREAETAEHGTRKREIS